MLLDFVHVSQNLFIIFFFFFYIVTIQHVLEVVCRIDSEAP